MGTLLQDLKYGLRMLAKNPGFTVVAVITLALGIGANTVIFSIANAILLRPLPYEDPDRLVYISEDSTRRPRMSVAYPNFLDWREQNTVFENMAAIQPASFNLGGVEEPERISGRNVSASFFSTLGVRPVLGRDFLAEDDKPGANPVVIMTHGLWEREFGANPAIPGKTITLSGRGFTVIGVLPHRFRFYLSGELFVPIGLGAAQMMDRGSHPSIYVVARLKRDIALQRARAEMDAISRRLESQYPLTNSGNRVAINPLRENFVRDVQPAILILLGAVGLVLLIACVNVANLLLARAAGREREIAIRAALGASRLNLIRQFLTESVLLSLIGGAFGLLLGVEGLAGLVGLIPDELRRATEINMDTRVLAFSFVATILTGIIFGLAPALQISKIAPNESLKESSTRATESLGRHRLRNLFVVSEVALALVLLIGAGLMIRSFYYLLQVDPGFNTRNLLTLQIALPEAKYPKPAQVGAFHQEALHRIETFPGVASVAVVAPLPLTGQGWQNDFYLEGRPIPARGRFPNSDLHFVSPNYFQTMGIPLLKGRYFTEADDDKAPGVAVISETMAQRYWPDEDPIGKRFRLGHPEWNGPWLSVVGIVGSTKQYGLDTQPRTEFYRCYRQQPVYWTTLVVRAAANPLTLVEPVRKAILSLDKEQPIYNMRTMDQVLAESVAPRRITVLVLGSFAALSLLLATVGVYGVMSYSVTQRTHEIGVRMAMGAEQGHVLKLVVGEGLVLALVGVSLGSAAAFGLTRLMSRLLFAVRPSDPLTFLAVSLALLAVALLASYIPARRATKVDPMVALRYE